MRIDGYVCNCGNEVFDLFDIDGPKHSSDYEMDYISLLRCTKCNSFHIRTVSCDYYDMSGDHDRYSETAKPISLDALANLLVMFDQPEKLTVNTASSRGRIFKGSMQWAQEFGDDHLVELVRSKKRGTG